jgi:hypothetical protein
MRYKSEAWAADEGEHLMIDAVHPLNENVQAILKYVQS